MTKLYRVPRQIRPPNLSHRPKINTPTPHIRTNNNVIVSYEIKRDLDTQDITLRPDILFLIKNLVGNIFRVDRMRPPPTFTLKKTQ